MNDLKSILRFALGLLALLFAVTFTSAADGDAAKEKKPSKAALEKYDTNKDGMLDAAELAAQKADIAAKSKSTKEANLANYDANKDGKLDEAEKAQMKAEADAAKVTAKEEKAAKKSAKDGEKK